MSRLIIIMIVLAGLSVLPAHAQRKQRRTSEQAEDAAFSPYAYETESTTKRKSRGRSNSGKKDRYAIDRPMAPTEFGRNERGYDYSKGPYFGHLRPVIKRPPGKQKLCRECGIWH